MRFTLKQVVDFCYEHKKRKGFKDFAVEQIAEHIIWAADNGKLVVVWDRYGLCGVVTYSTRKDNMLYIHHIVACRNGFYTLIDRARQLYPGYVITGLRRSKLVTFNPEKLYGRQRSRHLQSI